MKLRLQLAALTLLLALCTVAAACQTANRGTSTVTTSDEPSEPTQKEPLPPADTTEPRDTTGLEPDSARPGSDYREVALDSADPVACKQICDRQMRCMAFTYVRPDADLGPRCRLKHSIPPRVADQPCCVSGVNPRAQRRLAQLEAQGFELDTDRPGANFRSFEMDRPEPAICQEACQNLIACKAFTYVRPGHKGASAHCQLKDQVPDKLTDQDCCISGLK